MHHLKKITQRLSYKSKEKIYPSGSGNYKLEETSTPSSGGMHDESLVTIEAIDGFESLQTKNEVADYWRNKFLNYDGSTFPTITFPTESLLLDNEMEYEIAHNQDESSNVLPATKIYAAWALVIGQLANSTDIVFGSAAADSQHELTSRTPIAPIRILLDADQTIVDYLKMVEQNILEMEPYKHTGLLEISKSCIQAERASMLQTLFIISSPNGNVTGFRMLDKKDWKPSHALLIDVHISTSKTKIYTFSDSRAISPCMLNQLLQRLEGVVKQLDIDKPGTKVADIDIISDSDLKEIWKWNDSVPQTISLSVTEMVEERAMLQREALAVSAWDGELTYGELDRLSSQLAIELVNHPSGVEPNKIILLHFDKSMWTAVAMLGVLKAGAAFVLLDPLLPEKRLQAIVQQTKADLILCSISKTVVSSRLAREIIAVGPELFMSPNDLPSRRLPHPNPSSLMYVIFTSGTTGAPKGVAITHQNHASALHYQAKLMGLTSQSRIYDFSAYSFDLTIFNTFSAFTVGGCLCVPNEEQRRENLAESITSFRANWIYLTPTVARQLSPGQLPYLQSMVLIGEAVHAKDLMSWVDQIRVMNTYGPSECTTASTINMMVSPLEKATRIGKGIGMNTWVVDPDNHNKLMPIGCVGELLLEGPLVGSGYLGESVKTNSVFIKDPIWLWKGLPGKPGRQGRLYKTGDLVRYHKDGSLSFAGRKDNQVKIHGHRVELDEIEVRLHEYITGMVHATAEIIVPKNSGPVLVAFLQPKQDKAGAAVVSHQIPTIHSISTEERGNIARHLPSYMVPNIYLTMDELPLTATGKIDRKRLREIGGEFTLQQLVEPQTVAPKRRPKTAVERQLQKLWSQILGISLDIIGLDDSFLKMGGDSISAMRLVAEARKAGLHLSVADILQQPVFQEIANNAIQIMGNSKSEQHIAPFSLLGKATNIASLVNDLSSLYGVDPSHIKDIYPCTPLQEGLLSLSSRAGDYILQAVLEISPKINLVSFKRAWNEVFQTTAILRTRIVQHRSFGLLQMVLDGQLNWTDIPDASLDQFLENDKNIDMGIGQPLTRFALLRDSMGTAKWFVWTVHHSLYDEWSLSLLLDRAKQAYEGQEIEEPSPFQLFIKYLQVQDKDARANYWRETFRQCEAALFPILPPSVDRPATDSVIEYPLAHSHLEQRFSDITVSTLVRASWAMIASQMTNSDDVVFGATVSGRSAPVAGIYAVPAPTIATIPIRIQIPSRERKILEYLETVQKQSIEMIPFEQTGLHQIAKISSDAKHVSGFQTLLVIQTNGNGETQDVFGKWKLGNTQQSFNTYALILEIQLKPRSISVRASFDSKVIKPWIVQKMLERLDYVMAQLENVGQTLSEVQMLTSSDLKQIQIWNAAVPPTVEQSIPELLQKQTRAQPDATAVCAWDGEITYLELERLATSLAGHLVGLGVCPGVLVPVHFEKSMWTTVAILAILKAGGGFVLLDPYLPEQRLREIIRQIEAKFILSSVLYRDVSQGLTDHVITVNANFFVNLQPSIQHLGNPDPSSTAYVIFTSGSMGVPKGVLITHKNVASVVPQHIRKLGYSSHSRIYDFASYSFGAAINNVLAALISGACLCVPSDNDRRSNLAASLVSLRASVVLLTPSVAESLSPQKVPNLRCIIFGGEAVRMKDVAPWWGHVQVITAYGSSEVTTISTINADATCAEEATHIGKAVGGVSWIVDPDDHDCLLPPGCVGELLLQGPLVGRGYLGDIDKTEKAFIESPRWLKHGANNSENSSTRVYKTGDLVRYNEDGSLSYVGRKDAQVKIRGQRVELGEIETLVQEYLPDAKQIVAEVILPQAERPTPVLVVFTEPRIVSETTEEVTLLRIPSDVELRLAEYLPMYMIPSVLFLVRELPMTPTGKMNRRRLREIGATFTMKKLVEIQTGEGTKRPPTTRLEQQIQAVWSEVLNIDVSKIGIDDSFFQLGGDSITAMQVASLANMRLSIQLRVIDILKEKNISNITRTINSAASSALVSSQTNLIPKAHIRSSHLSPIQRLYFHLQKDPTVCFDQFFYLKLRRDITAETLYSALEIIVRRHDILRVRFKRNESGDAWEQHISNRVSESFHLDVKDFSDSQSAAVIISQCRGRLDVQNGPILSAVLFNNTIDGQTLFIDIHHLVVDLVSWRIILRELEDILTNETIMTPAPSVDFQHWITLQAQYAGQMLQATTGTFTQPKYQETLDYWGMSNLTENTRDGTIVEKFSIDESASSIILGRGNSIFNTRPLDLIISALIFSFGRTFHDRTPPTIFSEGHGRETWDDNIDISTTIGWFSTIFPVQIAGNATYSLADIIRRTKDSRLRLAKNGWEYFTSRFADEANSVVFAKEYPVEIMFNYAGVYQQLERSNGLFEHSSLPAGCDPPSNLHVQRFALFDIDVWVDKGQIVASIEFLKTMNQQDRIVGWIRNFETALSDMALELSSVSVNWTLSDFPLAFKSYDSIDEFHRIWSQLAFQHANIEDIFPCSPLQEGILVSQAREETNYQRWVELEVRVNGDNCLDIDKLKTAWKAVVKRHALLRAIVFDTFPGTNKMMHVVLKDPTPSISCTTASKAHILLEMNHAITDGFSQRILCRDLQSAYSGATLETAGSYKNFIEHLERQRHEESDAFWVQNLAGIEPCHLPISHLSGDVSSTKAMNSVHVQGIESHKIRDFCASCDVTPAILVQLAWALVLRAYTGSTSPCFGSLFSGRDVMVRGAEDTFGPFIGLVPFRIHLNQEDTVLDTLKQSQDNYLSILPYQHFPLAKIHRALGLGSRPLFNSLVSFQKVDDYDDADGVELLIKEISNFDPTEYDVTVDVMDSTAEIDIQVGSRAGSLTSDAINRLADCMSVALSNLVQNPRQSVQEISVISVTDLQQLQNWNSTLPEALDRCVHDMINERVKAQPNAPAICSWDGDLTYLELDRLANGLANRLFQLGITQGMVVPLCFEKSLWTSVAILAVLKVGGAFALLDTSLPEQRLQTIVDQIEAKIILSSTLNISLSSRLCKTVERIGVDSVTATDYLMHRKPQSSATAIFAIFTSGSTGTPKAAILTHLNIATCLEHQVKMLGFNKESRVYDFASYAFDVSVHNQIATFVTGGCLCVPSDDDRKNNLTGSMKAMRATLITITPSVARLIDPQMVPDLKTLIIGGEIITANDAARWWGKAHVVNIYGPAECHISTINATATKPEDIVHIGKGIGLLTWVVDPNNHDCLLPVGCIGELVLEGPLVGAGYIKEPEKTAAAFIQDPTWLLQFGRSGRMYKTGDLVCYNEDGTLMFLGRKDTQVKIRGQRVELGEIEHRVEECFLESSQVAAEVIGPYNNRILVAFIQCETGPAAATLLPAPSHVMDHLSKHLPHHMIPTLFFSVRQLPMTATGKVNRRSLQDIGASLSAQDVAEMQTATRKHKRRPITEIEQLMQTIWARILQINLETIGLDDAFFQLGGDSIGAMRVVAESRKLGLQLTVADIFNHTTLQNISQQSLYTQAPPFHEIPPFGLMSKETDISLLIQDLTTQHQLEANIVDIYPCTPLQEGLFSLSLKRVGDYTMQATLELSSDISLDRFKKAWEHVFCTMPILRTRIVQTDFGLQQIVLDEKLQWAKATNLKKYLQADRDHAMGIAKPLSRYALIQDDNSISKWFVWTIHHALYDGWSEPILNQAVYKAYLGHELESGPPFQNFIKYIEDKNSRKMEDYWRNTFSESNAVLFPTLPPSIKVPLADESIEHCFPYPQKRTQNITTSTLIRAAWALVAGSITDSRDVVFGVTVSGRTAPVTGIEALVAPTIATVPVRIAFSKEQTIGSFLTMVQQQSIDLIPYEQAGLQKIAKLSVNTQHACNFQTLLVIQPQESATDNPLGRWITEDQQRWFNTYGLVLVIQIASKNVIVKASFDTRVIDSWNTSQLMQRLEYVFSQLASAPPGDTLSMIEMATPQDLGTIWQWNGTVPTAADRFVQEMIADFAYTQPNATAVCAWDGDLTYKELDELSTKLGAYLFKLGANPNTFVSIFFEKSKWNTVAMLAVMKSTASFVLLDPSLPMRRLEAMVREVQTIMIVSSPLNNELSDEEVPPRPDFNGINYVVFTSGTTGNPKGAVITHKCSASAVKYQVPGFGYTTESRVYDFSTYSFDGAHFNAFTVLAAGGCLCVPTDHDRKNNLAESMEALKSNTVFLTPTVAALISPAQLPHLKVMILGGEAIRVNDIKPWWDTNGVRVFTLYGTSECTPVSMINPFPETPEAAVDIGNGYGVVTWVVDPDNHNSLMPLGCIGELLVEGPLVGTGYINNPTKTAAVFIESPAWMVKRGRTGRLYKTGDLVRYKKDGSLQFLGRKDAQVKIRGQRVELEDVERLIQESMPNVIRAAAEVIIPQGVNSSPMLVAFLQMNIETSLVGQSQIPTTSTARIITIPAEVEQTLFQNLPSYMMPSVFFEIGALPLGATGKLNRKLLQEIGSSLSSQRLAEARIVHTGPKRQPTTDIEHKLQNLWSKVLDIKPASMIGLDDSFFKLGGNSITAMKAVGEARKLGLQLSVANIFLFPKLHQTAEHVISLENNTPAQMITKMESNEPIEQSFAQGRLWFLEQLYPGLNWYHMPCVMRLRGPLNIEALRIALISLERRHETLRTVFFTANGIGMQRVLPIRDRSHLGIIQMPLDENASLMSALRRDETTPFDLEREPGWRVMLYKVEENHYVLSIVMHHIISDGWSVDILRKELASFYSAAIRGIQDPLCEIDPLPVQYRDFSNWEKGQASEHDQQLEYWATQLKTSRPAEMFCDKPRPTSLSGHADVQNFTINGRLYKSLEKFCQNKNVTPFIALLAAFRATHYRLTNQFDATIGSPNANRDRWEIKDVIGFFVNMQCLRIIIDEDSMSFDRLIDQVQSVIIDSFANQDVPFERVVSKLQHKRDLSRHPLVQIIFAVHSQLDLGQLGFEGIETQYIDQSITSRFDLECHIFQERAGFRCELLYSTDLFTRKTIRNFVSTFRELLTQALEDPYLPIQSMNLLTNDSLATLNEKAAAGDVTPDFPRGLSVVDLFQQQVIGCPNKMAVKDASLELTYTDLGQRSDVIASWLIGRELVPETLIGVYATRSSETIIAFLGILKANLAYMPFDSKIPVERLHRIFASINSSGIVLVGTGVQRPLPTNSVEFVHIEEIFNQQSSIGILKGPQAPSQASLAYVMFTSGSTGRPKGVMIEHRNIVRLVKNTNMLQHSSNATMAHISNIAFDASTWEIYATLLNGGTLICIDTTTTLDYEKMASIFLKEHIEAMFVTPALLKQYLIDCPSIVGELGTLYIGGDRLDPQDVFTARALMKHGSKIVNGYGPTENTSFSTMYTLSANELCTNGVPIGRAISNSGAYVMDSQQHLVPLGVVGELVVTGDGLARGYTDSEQNIDRFITISVDGKTALRAYRTGDYVRNRPTDGLIEYIGRMDRQIKVNGQRVEPEEIDHVLRSHENIADAISVLQEIKGREARLVSFVTLQATISEEQVQNFTRTSDDETKQIESWEELFNKDTYDSFDSLPSSLAGRDFVGWSSMYSGHDIDIEEMNEWLDDTINSITNGSESLNVLELGSGSGMILFNLSSFLESYIGLDPSERVINWVAKSSTTIPGLSEKIRLQKGTAADISQLGSISPNVVIVNSVVQYFPNHEYLLRIIGDILQLESVTTVFIGDVRSYAMYKEFQVGKALFLHGNNTSKDDIQDIMMDIEQSELELLVDPGFFTGLQTQFPDRIHHVEILPKRMKAVNELSCFRYAAVIHVQHGGLEQEIHNVGKSEWLDFTERQLDQEKLLKLMKSSKFPLAISNIPYRKTILERLVIDSLTDISNDDINWLSNATEMAATLPSLDTVDLEKIAKQAGCQVEISCARQYTQRGGLDAIFHLNTSDRGRRALFRFPTDHDGRSLSKLSSQPLQQQIKHRIRQQLQKKVEAQLPSYMTPKMITFLDKIPITGNGKVDRHALMKNLQRRTTREGTLRQPSTENERQMRKIWAQVLNLEPSTISLSDNFFAIGGDSLGAMKVVGLARKAGLKLTVADIFRGSNLEKISSNITMLDSTSLVIPRSESNGPVEQSFAQRRLWFLEQLHPGLTCVDAIEVQLIRPFQPKDLMVIDVVDEHALMEALHRDHTTPIDLRTEPGWRITLYRLGCDDNNHVLSIVMHHIISDGWSIEILQRELAMFYKIAIQKQHPLSMIEALPIQYRDFSIWQKSKHQSQEHEKQLNYWVNHLETSKAAEFFCDKPRPATLSGHAGVQSLRLEGEIYDRLETFCKLQQVTPFIVLLAVFRATHFRMTGVTDANIATLNANRHRWEVKDIIGFFVNLQTIRIRTEEESLEELVQQVHKAIADSTANQDVPFENIVSKLQKDRDPSRHPLSQILFIVHSQKNLGSFTLEGLITEQIPVPPTTRFDMEFHFFQESGALQGEILFSTDLYATESITSILSMFNTLLKNSLKDPHISLASLPLLSGEDLVAMKRRGLLDIVQSEYPRDSSIVDLFREQVAVHPGRLAVKDDSPTELTYAQLDQLSDNLANWLSKYSFAPGTLIGVFCKRSCQSVLTFMSILKAGLAYLPFHLKTPWSRMKAILSTLPGRKIVIVGSDIEPPCLQHEDTEFIRITDAMEEQKLHNYRPRSCITASGESLAYVMFTSGSTGNPKGVMIQHRGVVRLVKESNVAKHIPPAAIMAHLTNIAFDVSAWELYAALLNGGTLICIDTAVLLDSRALTDTFTKEKIQVASFTPALLKILLEQAPTALASVEALYIAGDRADVRDLTAARTLMKSNVVINAYGPTENSVFSTFYIMSDEKKCVNGVPIGHSVSCSGSYIVDKNQRLVPLGVVGELVVTGDGLAVGYTDPDLNLNRFITIDVQGERVRGYRTGDYVRWRPIDGEIEFFGRVDGQVKIRGHRVELGEIEHALRAYDAVNDAAVVLKQDELQEPQLLAFVAPNENIDPTQGHDMGTNDHVKSWEDLFNTGTYEAVDQVEVAKIGRDFIGWSSNYDGSSIGSGEMNEWLDETITAIKNSGQPLRVLEVGTGTGMILFNLPNGLIQYTGLEPSERAVEFVLRSVQSIPALSHKVCLYKGTAADIANLPTTAAPNLAIINSVAQYFPSQEYLLHVIGNILKLGTVETIFFGDIRSNALYREFQASKILFTLGDAVIGKDEFRQRMDESNRTELELLVDPAFFTALPMRMPQIEHVEILPKHMHATNELSGFRYAAVLHVKSKERRRIHEIGDNKWMDFVKEKLERESLLQCLQSTNSAAVGISNIPYSKTIVEKFLLESLDNGFDHHHWILTSRQSAQRCASLSPTDLSELAVACGFRVEISWARQYSQRGGIDAIFHRGDQKGEHHGRVLFKFPLEPNDRPSHSLTSRPLRQQWYRKIQQDLNQLLRDQLPPYMIPQAIIILEKMPVNDNGKVDRKALAIPFKTHPLVPPGAIATPSNDTERAMQRIWAQVLNIDHSLISIHDNFFHLGGNSILAMRVISEVRKLGLKLVVADIFNCDTLKQLALHCTKVDEDEDDIRSIVLIEPTVKATLLNEINRLDLSFGSSAVSDILPLTNFQCKTIMHGITTGHHANYFYFNLGKDVNIERLKTSCAMTLEKFPILRASFLRLGGEFWQIILRNRLDLAPVQIRNVSEDLDKASNSYCFEDSKRLSSSEFPLAFVLLCNLSEGSRLIVRLSHAQYDGVSFPIIFQSLMNSYNGIELPSGPNFSKFLSYSRQKRESSIEYWKKVLQGSTPTPIKPKTRPQIILAGINTPQRIFENAEISLPQLPSKVTTATLVSAAWAILLSSITHQQDVVYGNIVTGRNSSFQGIESIVGACLNIIPIRVTFPLLQTTSQLLQSIQQQFVHLGEADSLGFRDIIDHCTEWPVGSDFDVVIQHQNIEEHPEITFSQGSSRVQFYTNPDIVPSSLFIISYPKGRQLEIQLFANTDILTEKAARTMVHNLCHIITEIGNQLSGSLSSLVGGLQLRVN
ncbi:NRPS [Trichoderma virens]|nr:NRPS [Trichoderma virens]